MVILRLHIATYERDLVDHRRSAVGEALELKVNVAHWDLARPPDKTTHP